MEPADESLPSCVARGSRWGPILFVAQNIWENDFQKSLADAATLDTRPSCSTPFLDYALQRSAFIVDSIVERL